MSGAWVTNNSEQAILDKWNGPDADRQSWPKPSGLPVESTPKNDLVNHPSHYTFGKYEVLDVVEDWGLSFHLAQVVKYVARAKHKGAELQDLKKARFYLDRVIMKMEKE